MSPVPYLFIGAVAASLVWLFALAWLLDALGRARDERSKLTQTLQLYRATRDEAGEQIRDLLDQNTRLACLLIDAKAAAHPRVFLDARDPALGVRES